MENLIPADRLKGLYFKTFGNSDLKVNPLPPSGSNRQYFRLSTTDKSVIGVYNEDLKENLAFIYFSNLFHSKGLPVPQILAEDLDEHIYLQTDLGDQSLLSYIEEVDPDKEFNSQVYRMYQKILNQLVLIQHEGHKYADYSFAYPRAEFDRQSMMWDLNYFKYYFLKLAKVPFDEQLLENDFHIFCNYLLDAPRDYFLYRDFQSRNIMIVNNEPSFIDFQGGRKGALQYDVASLLFEAKTAIPFDIRLKLLDEYISLLAKKNPNAAENFNQFYYGFVYIRLMQAMGAYGFRGLYEKKKLFLQSIPQAVENLKWLRAHITLPVSLPHLEQVWDHLAQSEYIQSLAVSDNQLNVTISSFSYRRGIPYDDTGNGGGFVFDCRLLHNPGRYEQYRSLTGLDTEVIDFLETRSGVEQFLNPILEILTLAISNYQTNHYTSLNISFGCTGGQHRSVYCAEKAFQILSHQFTSVRFNLNHRELD